jgi:DNA-binding transcriptional LysR family regulator
MNSIDDIHIRRLDLTLLIVFEKLLKTRSMTAVADEMGLTQSAVSHAVGRLRSIFDDPLFVRNGAGVAPTARAVRLGAPLSEALATLRDAANIGRSFDPASAARRFAIAAPDTIVATLAETALAALANEAPRCQILFRVFSPESAMAAVADGEVDLAIGAFADPPREIVSVPLAHETFRVAARRDHPRLSGPLDLDAYCALDHLLVSHEAEPRGMVDAILAGLGRRRRVAAVMPQLLLAFAAASQSEAIVTAPVSACRYAASLFPLALHAPPIEIPGLALTLLRHREGMADPALAWLAGLATEALRAGSRA